MDEFDRTDVDATGRLADQQQVGVAFDLARENDLLLVAARKVLGRQFGVGRAHVETFHLFNGVGLDRGVIHQQAAAIGRVFVIAKRGVFPRLIVHDQTFALAVFGDVGDAMIAAGLAVGFIAGEVQRRAIDAHAALAGPIAAQNLKQLGLPVAGHASDAKDFARTDLQINAA